LVDKFKPGLAGFFVITNRLAWQRRIPALKTVLILGREVLIHGIVDKDHTALFAKAPINRIPHRFITRGQSQRRAAQIILLLPRRWKKAFDKAAGQTNATVYRLRGGE